MTEESIESSDRGTNVLIVLASSTYTHFFQVYYLSRVVPGRNAQTLVFGRNMPVVLLALALLYLIEFLKLRDISDARNPVFPKVAARDAH